MLLCSVNDFVLSLIHIQLGIEFIKPSAFLLKYGFINKRFLDFSLCVLHLLVKFTKLIFKIFLALREFCYGIIKTGNDTVWIITKSNLMAERAFERDIELSV